MVPKYESVIVDKKHTPLIELIGKTAAVDFALSPIAFSWEVENPDVCRVEDGMIYAGQNGTTVVTGRFGDVAVSVNVTVENSDKPVLVTDFTNDSDFERALSGV